VQRFKKGLLFLRIHVGAGEQLGGGHAVGLRQVDAGADMADEAGEFGHP